MIIDLEVIHSDLPSKSRLISHVEFLELTNITEEKIGELMDLGWLKPAQKTEISFMFLSSDVYKVRKLERLCQDFDISSLAAAIIVDLLEKVDLLEAQIKELRGNKE